jgi:hypothetical protein
VSGDEVQNTTFLPTLTRLFEIYYTNDMSDILKKMFVVIFQDRSQDLGIEVYPIQTSVLRGTSGIEFLQLTFDLHTKLSFPNLQLNVSGLSTCTKSSECPCTVSLGLRM